MHAHKRQNIKMMGLYAFSSLLPLTGVIINPIITEVRRLMVDIGCITLWRLMHTVSVVFPQIFMISHSRTMINYSSIVSRTLTTNSTPI